MLLDDIATYLGTVGPFTFGGDTYTVRKFFSPDTPDTVIAVLEFAAGSPHRAMGASLRLPVREQAGLQVLVRGPQEDYASAMNIAQSVNNVLDYFSGTLSGRSYFIEAQHSPALLEQDRNNRWRISTNYIVLKERG